MSPLPLRLEITNQRSQTIEIYWVNYQGEAVSYGQMPSEQRRVLKTYSTHPWLFATTNGELLAYLVPLLTNIEFVLK